MIVVVVGLVVLAYVLNQLPYVGLGTIALGVAFYAGALTADIEARRRDRSPRTPGQPPGPPPGPPPPPCEPVRKRDSTSVSYELRPPGSRPPRPSDRVPRLPDPTPDPDLGQYGYRGGGPRL